MIVIDTPYHVSFDDSQDCPTLACSGRCKKAWWVNLLPNAGSTVCPLCNGPLCEAVEKVHYNVLAKANRKLKLSDFTGAAQINHSDKLSIKKVITSGAHISNISIVKPKFVEKARSEWCN